MWRCTSCGFIWQADEAPDECPKCEAQKAKFEEVDAKSADTIERARYTNSVHMNIYSLLEQIMALAEEGIDDNLDPNCVRIFEDASDQAAVLQQSILAEIQSHVKKAKWG